MTIRQPGSASQEASDLNVESGLVHLAANSFSRMFGNPLPGAPSNAEMLPAWVYADAPYGILIHDSAPDPVFVYANRTAQRCFEYEWSELVGMPSRLSAGPMDQHDRIDLLKKVSDHGGVVGYRGLRVAASGRKFWVEDLTMWNLVDETGVHHGQAALFTRWVDAEGVV